MAQSETKKIFDEIVEQITRQINERAYYLRRMNVVMEGYAEQITDEQRFAEEIVELIWRAEYLPYPTNRDYRDRLELRITEIQAEKDAEYKRQLQDDESQF